MLGRRFDVQRTADKRQTLADANKTEPGCRLAGRGCACSSEASAVIFDDEPYLAGFGLENDAYSLGLRVPHDIGHRLLQHPIKRDLNRSR